MKKVLVPIDFSPASLSGFRYAVQISLLTGADLYLLNVYPEKGKDLPDDVLLLLEREEEKKRKLKLEQFTKTYPHETDNDLELNLKLHYLLRAGNIEEQISNAGIDEGIDLTIIGTKSKHSLLEYIFGSVSSKLIQKTKIPLLIIPEGTTFSKPKKIGYGTELYINETPVYQYLDEFATALDAEVEQVHINIFPSDFFDLKEEVINTKLGETGDSDHNIVTIVRDTSVKRGIDFFIESHNIDILALFMPKRSLRENLLHRSLSRRYALSGKTPLLIIKEFGDS